MLKKIVKFLESISCSFKQKNATKFCFNIDKKIEFWIALILECSSTKFGQFIFGEFSFTLIYIKISICIVTPNLIINNER